MPGKSDEAKLAKLIRKNMEKAEKAKAGSPEKRRKYDPTLPPEGEGDNDSERRNFFSEMKKREF